MILHRPAHLQNAHIELPYSKSIQNRLLVLEFLSGGKVSYDVRSDADDSVLMHSLLNKIKGLETDEVAELDCKNAGTVMRFLTAVCAMQEGEFVLTGSKRMQQRPIADLVTPLQKLGAEIHYLKQQGYPPLKIKGRSLQANAPLEVATDKSSQFISALMLIAPCIKGGVDFVYDKNLPSASYVQLSLSLLRKLGAELVEKPEGVYIQESRLKGRVEVERDWSSAAFFYSMVALSDNLELQFQGLSLESIQGDRVVADIYAEMGVETIELNDGLLIKRKERESRHFSYDFSDCPDLALPVIACCAGLNMMASLNGLRNLKYKESDRLMAICTELSKFGYDVRPTSDDDAVILNDCKIAENKAISGLQVKTYADHRMAMSIAPLVLLHDNLEIENPEVVEKSFPTFWEELARLIP